MADLKISQLAKANVVNKGDLLYLVQDDTSLNVDAGTLFASIADPTLAGNIVLGGPVQVMNAAGTVSITTTRTDLYGGVSANTDAINSGTVLPATIYLYTEGLSATGRGLTFATGTPINKTLYARYKNEKIYLSAAEGSNFSYPPEDWIGTTGLRPFPTSVSFIKGSTYIFDVSDPSNTGNVLALSTSIDGTNTLGTRYTGGANVIINGTPGTAGANVTFTVPNVTVDTGGKAYLDLPAGADGQLKVINLVRTDGGRFVLSSNLQNNLAIELKKSGDSAFLMYSSNGWILVGSNPGLITSFSGTSDDVTEGSKLYFTNARARAAITAGDTTIIYDRANGTIKANATVLAGLIGSVGFTGNTNAVAEGSLNLYYTNARVYANVIGLFGAKANVSDLTTSNVAELTNLYYTNARVYSNVISLLNNYATAADLNRKANVVDLTTANVAELTNLYYTNARVYANVIGLLNAKANVVDLTTANVRESTSNLYFTNARVYSNVLALLPTLAGDNITIAANGRISSTASGSASPLATSIIGLNTANVSESASNLYYTNARVFANVIGLLNVKSNVSDLTTANVTELTNLYYTNARVYANVIGLLNAKANVSDLTTANVAELTNLYYTNARVFANVVSILPTYTGNLNAGNINATNSITVGTTGGGSITGANLISANNISATNWLNLYTANVVETASNLYFTNARVYSNVLALLPSLAGNNIEIAANGRISANLSSVTGSIQATTILGLNTANVPESSSNLYYTDARVYANILALLPTLAGSNIIIEANGRISSVGITTVTATAIIGLDTSNVREGSNLYFTNARAVSALVGQDVSLNNLVVAGNLTVQGDVVTLNTATLTVEDKNILLANGATSAALANGAGISIAGANANLTYLQATDSFDLNKNLTITGNILPTVGNLYDIGSNDKPFRDLWLYGSSIRFSNSGSISQQANTIVVTDGSGNVILSANSTNKPITSPSGTLTANLLESVVGYTTANIAEGSNNLYFTNARAIAAIQPSIAELRALTSSFSSNVLYVAGNGNDANDGRSFGNAFANIHVALAAATQWTTVFVKSGDYKLYNQPVTIPTRVALVGDNLRTTTIRPSQPTVDMFYVNNACYVTGITFRDHQSPSAAFSFNPNGSAGTIITSPYIQNCSSITTTGTGMRVDGRYVSGLRSMVCDAYTQTNEGGIGIHMLNRGYTQLVSVFTICCSIAIKCESGGFCSITNSNAAFGTYGLWADGVSDPLYFGKVQTATTEATAQVTLSNLSIRPNYGDSVIFANYNQDKCSRDTGLIVDSLAIDLAYNSNTQSTFAGLQYWAQSASAIPNQGVETIAAINYAKSLATNIVANIRITSPYQGTNVQQFATSPTLIADQASNVKIATEFDLITSIISNGTAGISDLIVPNGYPANTNAFVNHASNLLYLNNVFIASEVVTFVNTTYPGFVYNVNTCFRDVGFILDSIRFDLLHGGNRQAVQAGAYYYQYDATDTQINDQVVQTGAAYYFIGGLVEKIVKGTVISNVYQTTFVQNTTAAAYATNAEANLLLDDIILIANIVTNGPSVAPAKTAISLTPNTTPNVINATKLVIANRDFIKAEVLEFVNQNWANISNGAGTFYTVLSATPLVSNTSTVTFLQNVTENLLANTRVSFHQGSYISSSGHTFEYVGSGTTIATALPYLGGVPIQENEVVELRGGQVYFTSTDQLGDFRIGNGLVINRVDGTITGRTFNKALFAVMTPYILAIEG